MSDLYCMIQSNEEKYQSTKYLDVWSIFLCLSQMRKTISQPNTLIFDPCYAPLQKLSEDKNQSTKYLDVWSLLCLPQSKTPMRTKIIQPNNWMSDLQDPSLCWQLVFTPVKINKSSLFVVTEGKEMARFGKTWSIKPLKLLYVTVHEFTASEIDGVWAIRNVTTILIEIDDVWAIRNVTNILSEIDDVWAIRNVTTILIEIDDVWAIRNVTNILSEIDDVWAIRNVTNILSKIDDVWAIRNVTTVLREIDIYVSHQECDNYSQWFRWCVSHQECDNYSQWNRWCVSHQECDKYSQWNRWCVNYLEKDLKLIFYCPKIFWLLYLLWARNFKSEIQAITRLQQSQQIYQH